MSRRRILLGLLLTGMGVALLGGFMLVMLHMHRAGSRPNRERAKVSEADEKGLGELLQDYQSYGLPLPPENADLVKLKSDWRHVDLDGKETPIYLLGFLIKPGGGKPVSLMVGTQEYLPKNDDWEVIIGDPPNRGIVGRVEAEWSGSKFPINAGLATAIQCKARGWDDLAQALLAASLQQGAGHSRSGFHQPAGQSPKVALANLAWAHWANEIIKPGSDRSVVAQRIKLLLDANPHLSNHANRYLLHSLEAALQPSTAQPNSIEALIDNLVNSTYCRGHLLGRQREPDARYLRLLEKGFDAVPSLIEHLEDNRLTRGLSIGFNNFPTYHLRVQDVVSDLLQEMADQDLGKDWLRRTQGYGVTKADARAWWEKVKKLEDQSYVLDRVLPAEAKAPNDAILQVVAGRYPKHLPMLYRTLLDRRPEMQSDRIAKAITASSLPRQTKVDLFLYAGKHKNLEHRRAALAELKELDEPSFVTVLSETLELLPKTPAKPYWDCPEASFASLVTESEDARPWETLAKVARRSDIGLRLEFMRPMHHRIVSKRQQEQRLHFLAAFLDDSAVRDANSNPPLFDGPHAGFLFPRLAVRDFAAMQIASILNLPAEPEPDWTSEQWAKLRAQVREALQREAAKSKKKAETTPKRGQ